MATTTPTRGRSRQVAKRVLVGRAKSSDQLEHTLLPKIIALPVFASDPLSSNAYATEEILLVLLTTSAASMYLVMPIALAIALLMTIVITSYRQTVRAYPSGGGAYIVSKENLGTLPGLVAAAALLIDYVLTVSVSISAGVLAISSAFPSVGEHSVLVSLAFLTLLTLANLRGVKEAGSVFAFPTYAFVLSIFVMVVVGAVRCVGGCPATEPMQPAHELASTAGSISLFVVLHAFSSGSTALTGVEAISNGVQAFRRPQARNAARTLGVMGVMAITMFLGISWLATHIPGITVSQQRSVVAQVADAVFDGGVGFYVVQAFTAAILILAANTAYQDFPRLSSILARDGFLPSQFKNRGDRLVFSNGVLVLATFAGALIYVFEADLSRLIQLYVVGVFTSFTLSQTGMVRHWMRVRDDESGAGAGWRRSIAINAVGATTTGIVLMVITGTKFVHGAWIVISAMPLIVIGLLAVHRHYEHVRQSLMAHKLRVDPATQHRFVFLVRNLGPATNEALSHVRALRPVALTGVYVGEPGGYMAAAAGWVHKAPRAGALERLPHGRTVPALRSWIAAQPRDEHTIVTVVIPEEVTGRSLWAVAAHQRFAFLLKARMLFTPDVAVMDEPLVPEGLSAAIGRTEVEREVVRSVVLVPVSAMHDGTVRAISYARALGAAHVEAVYFAADPEVVPNLVEEWMDVGLDVPLSFVEAPYRDLGPPLLGEVRRHTERAGTVVTVVIPEFLVTRWWEHPLHGQTALFIKRLLLVEPQTVVVSVPYKIRRRPPRNSGTSLKGPRQDRGSPR
ncbi:MAG: APC family permease [Actinomycetota bacterium]|nr:APC family permease [Actinomycetota bacterium]